MSLAPTPGVGARAEAAVDATQILTLTVKGVPYTLAMNNVPLDEQEQFFKQTGLTYECLFMEPYGAIKVVGVWFLARRLNGERQLTWQRAKREWPDDLAEGELDLQLSEPDLLAVDPEA